MSKVLLGDVARERRETCKGSKDGYPVVGLEHLTPEEITLSNWDEGKDNTFTKLFRKGDVLFGRRRAYLKKAAVAPFDGICSGDITVIEAIPEKILPELLPFIIQNDALFDFAVGKSAGSLSPRVKWEHLRNYSFELPNMEEQRRLAKVLWAMDATKKAYQKLIQKTDELVKSQFIALFGNPLSEGSRWDAAPITDACAQILGGGTPSTKHPEYFAGTIPWVSPKDMKSSIITDSIDHITEEAIANSTTNLIPANSVLMVIRSGILKHDLPIAINSVPVTINQDMKAFVVSSRLHPQYLMGYFRAIERDVLLGVRAVTADNIDFKAFQKRLVPIPPMALQEQYAAFVQQSDKSKFEIEQALAELTATYKRIIAENLG